MSTNTPLNSADSGDQKFNRDLSNAEQVKMDIFTTSLIEVMQQLPKSAATTINNSSINNTSQQLPSQQFHVPPQQFHNLSVINFLLGKGADLKKLIGMKIVDGADPILDILGLQCLNEIAGDNYYIAYNVFNHMIKAGVISDNVIIKLKALQKEYRSAHKNQIRTQLGSNAFSIPESVWKTLFVLDNMTSVYSIIQNPDSKLMHDVPYSYAQLRAEILNCLGIDVKKCVRLGFEGESSLALWDSALPIADAEGDIVFECHTLDWQNLINLLNLLNVPFQKHPERSQYLKVDVPPKLIAKSHNYLFPWMGSGLFLFSQEIFVKNLKKFKEQLNDPKQSTKLLIEIAQQIAKSLDLNIFIGELRTNAIPLLSIINILLDKGADLKMLLNVQTDNGTSLADGLVFACIVQRVEPYEAHPDDVYVRNNIPVAQMLFNRFVEAGIVNVKHKEQIQRWIEALLPNRNHNQNQISSLEKMLNSYAKAVNTAPDSFGVFTELRKKHDERTAGDSKTTSESSSKFTPQADRAAASNNPTAGTLTSSPSANLDASPVAGSGAGPNANSNNSTTLS